MSKAFTSEETEDLPPLWRAPPSLLPGQKRYITAAGHHALLQQRARWEADHASLVGQGGWQTEERVKQLASSLEALDATLNLLTVAQTPAPDDTHVRLGSSVTVKDGGRVRVMMLVGPDETDGTPDKVSMDSPLGRALMGTQPGDDVEVELPRGDTVFSVMRVEQPR